MKEAFPWHANASINFINARTECNTNGRSSRIEVGEIGDENPIRLILSGSGGKKEGPLNAKRMANAHPLLSIPFSLPF